VEKSSIEIAGFIEISDDTQEPGAVQAIETDLDVGPRCQFLLFIAEFAELVVQRSNVCGSPAAALVSRGRRVQPHVSQYLGTNRVHW
jgi:hypothetical protein